jgi:hypothetical protein
VAETSAFRVHPQLGVLVKLPGQEHWRWILPPDRVQPGHVADAFADGPGWTDPLEDLRARLELEVSRRTLGGTPPPCDQRWANAQLSPPPSASDPDAPPHRREGMASSRDGWKRSARPPLADHAVRGREGAKDVLHIVDGGGRLRQTILDPACAEPVDDRCRNCGRTQAHCDRRTIKFCCSNCDHPGSSK